MALKKLMKSLNSKKEIAVQEYHADNANTNALLTAADFPIIRASDVNLSRYQKVPLTGIAALGAAFSTLPNAARTIAQTATTRIATDKPVFVGIWPQGVIGKMIDKGKGHSGNILGPDNKIVGRMRFQQLDGLPLTTNTSTVIPFNPMTMAVAAALINIDKKLDALQEKAEEILQFLKLEKQSRQRGNLNMLAEITEEYKRDCHNEKMCALRVVAVQDIKREAHQDILFYEEQIGRELRKQRAIHGVQIAQNLLDAVMNEFYEFQLASYLYAYASFLEVMLQKNLEAASAVAKKMESHAKKYSKLYSECRSQIANYQRSAIEAQLIGGLGSAAKTIGQAMASVPVLSKGPVDEALISVGESLGQYNEDTVSKKLETFAPLEDSCMQPFIENTRRLDLLYRRLDSMITDGENLYILAEA